VERHCAEAGELKADQPAIQATSPAGVRSDGLLAITGFIPASVSDP
jgi:hypothetical protein